MVDGFDDEDVQQMSYLYYLHTYIFTYDSYDVSIIRLFTITI